MYELTTSVYQYYFSFSRAYFKQAPLFSFLDILWIIIVVSTTSLFCMNYCENEKK